MDDTLNRLRQSRYLGALLEAYYSTDKSDQRDLDAFINAPAKEQQSHLLGFIPRVKAAQNAAALQELKNEFTVFWSLASLASTLGFAPLSILQSDFAAATIDQALSLAWQDTTQRLRLKPAQDKADTSPKTSSETSSEARKKTRERKIANIRQLNNP